jgi:hypothetical protein
LKERGVGGGGRSSKRKFEELVGGYRKKTRKI